MTGWTLNGVRASGERYLRELGRARLDRLAGRAAPSAQEIRDAYRHELGRGAIDLALEVAEGETADSPGGRSGRALLAWLMELEVSDRSAPVDRWLSEWRNRATVRTPDARVVPFASIDREIAREGDRAMRIQLDTARVALVERDLAPTLIERAARERDAIEQVGIGAGLREVAERLTGDDVDALAIQAREALTESVDSWRDSLSDRLRRDFSIARSEARPADVAAALDASLFDAAFRASDRESLARRAIGDLGLHPTLGGGLHIEPLVRLAGAASECIATDLPGEIHVVFGQEAGIDGHRSALRAVGVALRLGHVEGDAPFEHRWLGDPAVPAMCAMVIGSVALDEGWLMRYADLSRSEARRLLRIMALTAMYELRHACALHIHYVESIDAELPVGARQESYAELVGKAIGVRPHGVDALLDAPPVLTPTARLRGMQGAAVLSHELVERFDVDWYRNPRAGPWLKQAVLAPACAETAAEMVKGATGRDLSFGPYLVRLERALAA